MSQVTNSEIPSVAKSIFFGEVNESHIFPFPSFTEEQSEMAKGMVDAVTRFCETVINSAEMDKKAQIPTEVIQGLADLGLCGMAVPEQYGGLDLDYSLYSRVFEAVAGHDGSCATMLGAHQSIGYAALLNEGNEQQKQKWLPRLASGEILASFCLTEPSSGSDAYSIKTKAVDDGQGNYIINGQKLWITNAGTAEFYTVYCKTDHEIDGEKKERISAIIVEKEREGISFGEKEDKLGIRASETRAIFFENVKVPKENLIGEPGKGFKIAMNVLNSGRLSLGSGCVGGMRKVIEMATKQAMERKQFDRSISEFGMVQAKLARMASRCYAAESTVYFTTGKMVQGMSDYSVESAICKVFCSDAMWETIDEALQIAAGNGYMKEYPYEQIMRDVRINLIFEGTNEILRVLIALSGIKGPSDRLKELGKIASDVSSVLSDPIKSLGLLSDYAKKRTVDRIAAKSFSKIHSDLEEMGTKLLGMINEFAISVEDLLKKYGKNIIGNELPQKRVADMAINMFVMLCTLSRTTEILNKEDVSSETKEYVTNLTKMVFKDCRAETIKNWKAMDNNQDEEIISITKTLCGQEGYGLDVIDY